MKKLFLLFGTMSTLALSSCGGASGSGEDSKEKQLDSVRMFVVDVATKVSKNQKDSVVMLYSDAAKADSLALTFVADSVKVEEIDSVTFSADFGKGKSLCIKKDAQGKLTVAQSIGLFIYPEKDLDFAKKTGMWTDSLTDVQFAERMATMNEFRNYLIKNYKVINPLVIKKGSIESHYSADNCTYQNYAYENFIVTNTSQMPISANEYKVLFTYTDPRTEGTELGGYEIQTKKGQDIAPGASVTYKMTTDPYGQIRRYKIAYTTNRTLSFEKNFTPKGDEYQKYLNSKNK